MYRQIITPENTNFILHLPAEFVGKEVEVIAFPLGELQDTSARSRQTAMEEAEKFYRSINIDMSKFKFDREKAHER